MLECSFPRKKFDEKNILSGNQSDIAPIQSKGFSLSALIRHKNYSYHLVFLLKEYSNIVLIRLMNYTNIELILLNSYSLFMLIRAKAFSDFVLIRSKMHSLHRVGNGYVKCFETLCEFYFCSLSGCVQGKETGGNCHPVPGFFPGSNLRSISFPQISREFFHTRSLPAKIPFFSFFFPKLKLFSWQFKYLY